MEAPKILLVENEPDVSELIKFNLITSGFLVTVVSTAQAALDVLENDHFRVAIISSELPEKSGIDLCKSIRETRNFNGLKIIALSTTPLSETRIADEYLEKPVNPKQMLSAVNTLLRKVTAVSETQGGKVYEYKNMYMDTGRAHVDISGQTIKLTASEFNILKTFIESPGQAFSRQQLIDTIRGSDYAVTERTIDFQMVGLRRKLGDLGKSIETVRGVGYRLREDS